jgi:hypothetical protein
MLSPFACVEVRRFHHGETSWTKRDTSHREEVEDHQGPHLPGAVRPPDVEAELDDVSLPITMIDDGFDQIPAVAVAVFKDDHGAVGLVAGLLGHADATRH